MAAEVEVQPGEVGRAVAGGRLHLNPLTDASNTNLIEIPAINQARIIASEPNKPAPALKPRLSPKPFAVERNPTIKPILAPKPQTKPRPESTRLPGHKPEPPSNPRSLQTVASRPVSSNTNRPASTSFKTSNKLNAGQTTKPITQPFKPAPPFDAGVTSKPGPSVLAERQKPAASSYAKNFRNLQAAEWSGTTLREDEKGQGTLGKGGTSITRAKSMGFLLDVGQEVEKKEGVQPEAPVRLRAQSRGTRIRPVSAIFPDSLTTTETAAPAPRWVGRRPLSADLTSKFESIGLSLHRKSEKSDTWENTAEEKPPPLKREQDKITPQRGNSAGNPALTDQSINKAEETTVKETDDEDDKGRASIKSRISLFLDLSSSSGPTGQGSDFPSPVQPASETESTSGVKKLIKQLTEDTTPTQSPVMKPSQKPRPLPLDLTKRFSSERSADLISLSETSDRHEIIKGPQRRAEESVVTPNDQKTFLDSKDSQEQLKKASTPEGPGGPIQTVRASLFENVVERHSVFMMDNGGSSGSPSSKRRDLDNDGSLFIATYKEPVSPSSPLHVQHAFDTVQAIEKNRAVSEMVPSAHWEDKAMTLRSKRSDGSRPVAEGTSPAQGQASSVTAEPQPRYLRVGALTKFSNSDPDQNTGLDKGVLKDSQREGQEKVLEQEDAAAAPKRLKMLPTEEQSKPRATYFALTGQIQEPFFLGEVGTSIGDMDEHSTRSALRGVQGKSLPIRRNPSLEEAFGKTSHSLGQVEELMKSHLSYRDLIELEKQRLKEKKEREEAEKMRQVALEQEMFRMRELEKGRHKEVDLRSALNDQRKEEVLDAQKKRDLQKETERHMAKLKEFEKEKRDLEMEKQAQARMKDLEMQREVERQRQKVLEMQKWEIEEKQRALEMQKQIELEKQRLQEVEKLKLERERQRQLEREKRLEAERMQERERQRERERQKQREEERQRELDKERRLLEIQKEKQKLEEMEKLKEQERQQLLEIQKQKQREKERQQVIEYEKQRLREKKEREQAEKMKAMALEQEMLRIRELDKERERLKEMERERQKEIEREKQRQEQERQQLIELQKQKQREKERQQQIELENQRQKEKREREEAEKIKQMALEQEMLRIRELEKEKERHKEMERAHQKEIEREKQRMLEQQRKRDLERERQRQLDMERQEMENQRLRQREQEKEKKRLEDLERLKEMERQQLLEFEKQKRVESDRQQIMELEKRRLREKQEAEKMRQIAKQQEAERQRLKEKQRKEEQERLRQESAPMRPKVLDLDSVLRNEPLVKATAQRSDPANRWKEPYRPAILDIDSFTSQTQHSPGKDLFPVSGIQGLDSDFGVRSQHTPERDASWKTPQPTSGSFSSPVWTTAPQDPWELRPVEMSVDKPAADPRKHVNKLGTESLLFRQDDQPWTPQRNWPGVQDEPLHSAPFPGTETGTTNTPSGLTSSSPMELNWLPKELQPQENKAAVHNQRRSQGSQELNRMRSRSVSRRSAPAGTSVDGNLSRVRSRSAHREQDRHSWVPQKQAGEEEAKDSGTPVRDTDSQYGTWETGLRTDDSLTPATPSSESNLSPSPKKPATPLTPGDAASQSEADTPDGVPPSSSSGSQPLAFPDAPTTLLDTSVLRSRAQLGKKRAPRTRPTRAARQTATLTEEEPTENWLYRDSTEAKPERKEEDSDSEEPARGADSSPAVALQPQRVALFPGMDPSALKAQLKKRGDSDNQVDGAAASPSQLTRSPKSPFLPRAARVLPPPGGKENGEENSPQWLKELKSKKRLSQYESES